MLVVECIECEKKTTINLKGIVGGHRIYYGEIKGLCLKCTEEQKKYDFNTQ